MIEHPAAFSKNGLGLQRAFVHGCERLAPVDVPSFLGLHVMVSEHWNTCGPEWYNNNFVSSGNDVFPDLGNTRLRLEQRTGN